MVKLRKRCDEDYTKILPIIQDNRLTSLIVNHLHQSRQGGILIGRRLHLLVPSSMKVNYNSPYGFYRTRLQNLFTMIINSCWICSLAYPKEVKGHLGSRVAGAVPDNPYSHVSIDDIKMGSIQPHPNARFVLQHTVLAISCLLTGHITLETIQNCTSKSIALALRRVELKNQIDLKTIWSDNYSSLRENSFGEPMTKKFHSGYEGFGGRAKSDTF